ncbi:MAG: hypothetical protein UH625_02785 [Muribaculaceae bacterium]|nr:hypothetical protein [Muribaculaceae bacterium]
MKKSIKFLLSFLLVTTLLTACKSEQDTAFVGRWAGASEEGKLFNKRVLYGVELELERGDLDLETVKSLSLNNSKATLSVSINGVVFINAEGKWSADDKKINFDFDKTEVTFDKAMEGLSSSFGGTSLRDFARQVEEGIADGSINLSSIAIVSSSTSKIVLDLFGTETTLNRVEDEGEEQADNNEYTLVGTVAGQPVKMVLTFMQGSVTGKYCYTNVNTQQWLEVEGSEENGVIVLTEKNADGMVTGTFEFNYNPVMSPMVLIGSMTNYKGKTYTAELTQE